MVEPEEHYRRLERMYAGAPTNRYYAPELRVSEGQAQITIPIRPDFFHSAGAIHGSVYFKILDDAAFFAASSLVSDVFVLTVSFTTYIVRPVSRGFLRAVGSIVHQSRSLIVAESTAYDAESELVARGSGTFIPSRIRLSPDVGYQ